MTAASSLLLACCLLLFFQGQAREGRCCCQTHAIAQGPRSADQGLAHATIDDQRLKQRVSTRGGRNGRVWDRTGRCWRPGGLLRAPVAPADLKLEREVERLQ